MNVIVRPLYWTAGKLFSIWARPAIQPEVPAELITNGDAAVCYVLEYGGLADLLALERACETHGLPSPSQSFRESLIYSDHATMHSALRILLSTVVHKFLCNHPVSLYS